MGFQEDVWKLLKEIPEGYVTTYKILALVLNNPNASRAVGNACNANPSPVIVPCHRVINSSGHLGGYAKGSAKKAALLKKEGHKIVNGKLLGFEQKLWKF